nr:hypothetical protein CFP56_63506 [Quercus suber]
MLAPPSPPLPPDPYPKRRNSRSTSRVQLPPQSTNVEPSRARNRTSSQASLYQPQPQPIKDAVNDAFHNSPAQSQIDPELVRQVTEQVIKNLQQTMLNSTNVASPSVPAQSVPNNIERRDKSPRPNPSPALRPNDALPPRFTPPPSPDKSRPARPTTREWAPSVDAPDSGDDTETTSTRRMAEHESTNASVSDFLRNNPDLPQKDKWQKASGRDTYLPSHPDNRSDRSGRSPDSNVNDAKFAQTTADTLTQPRPTTEKVPEVQEATTLEKVWGTLFANGTPTVRLSQFLRGLAAHLINDYEPKGSLVVTPPKMLRFFAETRLSDEKYPWEIIFAKMSNASLAIMYRKLLCQHHFVQSADHEAPNVPALTPRGFELFITTLMQAHPEEEFDRLSRAVMHMPISNADDKSERFPKELPRRLLPSQPNVQAELRLVSSLHHESHLIQLKGAQNIPPPPRSAPPTQSMFPERERKPYSSTTQSDVLDENDPDCAPASVPIERERKPYTAKGEGSGKQYDVDQDRDRERGQHRTPPTAYRSENPGVDGRSRTGSNLPTQSSFTGNSESMSVPSNRHRKSFGQTTSVPPPSGGFSNFARAGRRSPPPPRNSHGWIEPANVAEIPSSQYASNMPRGSTIGARDTHSNDADEERWHQDARTNARL